MIDDEFRIQNSQLLKKRNEIYHEFFFFPKVNTDKKKKGEK